METKNEHGLAGGLLISRVCYKGTSIIISGVVLLLILMAAKSLAGQFGWFDIPICLVILGIYIFADKTQKFLSGIWGKKLLQASQDEALVKLRDDQENLNQRGW